MSKNFRPTYKRFGSSAVLIEWPEAISEEILDDIQLFSRKIVQLKKEEIIDVNYVYCSMVVTYNSDLLSFNFLESTLKEVYNEKVTFPEVKSNRWRIPVCYEVEFGLDLIEFSQRIRLNESELIQMHTNPVYKIYGMGFLPGFLYLGGLSEKLHMPRKETPRMHIPKGSVAIGGSQTGIYPQDSPGGWHIIGKTPITIFDSNRESPSLVSVGDEIEFYAVSKARYKLIALELESGVHKYEAL